MIFPTAPAEPTSALAIQKALSAYREMRQWMALVGDSPEDIEKIIRGQVEAWKRENDFPTEKSTADYAHNLTRPGSSDTVGPVVRRKTHKIDGVKTKVGVEMPLSMKEALQKRAHREGVAVNLLLRHVIEDFLSGEDEDL
jgi:hypothetical protein